MLRVLVLLVIATGVARAQNKAPTAASAKAATEAAFKRALGKLKLKPVKLAPVPADPEESTDERQFVGNVVDKDPMFVVDANKDVYRVVRKINTVGRVKVRVCNAGPPKLVRVKRTRFAVPAGHAFKGDVEVAYDAFVLDEQNTCRLGERVVDR